MDYWLNWRGDLGFWIFDQSKASLMMTDNEVYTKTIAQIVFFSEPPF